MKTWVGTGWGFPHGEPRPGIIRSGNPQPGNSQPAVQVHG
jgi:hypothetical protein